MKKLKFAALLCLLCLLTAGCAKKEKSQKQDGHIGIPEQEI